jgi:hypothetical protein
VMLESYGQQTEQDLARIAWEICRDAQQHAMIEDGMIDILNCTNGGVISPSAGW